MWRTQKEGKALAPKLLIPGGHSPGQCIRKGLYLKNKATDCVAVAHATQCPYCIRAHTRIAMRKGATKQEIMEAVWVAAEMRAGAGYSHSILAMDEMEKVESSAK